MEDQVSVEETIEFRVYRRRWILLASIFFLNISSSVLWMTYASVSGLIASRFDVSDTAVSMLSMVFYIAFVVMSIPSGWVIDQWGIRPALLIGAFFNLLGAWIRYGAIQSALPVHGQYVLSLVGQIISAIGQPFFLNAPTKFAATWFTDRGRGAANTIATLSNPIGIAIGQLIVPALAPTAEGLPTALLVTAVIATASAIATPFIASAPPTPPEPAKELLRRNAIDSTLPPSKSGRDISTKLSHLLPGLLTAIRSPGFLVLFFIFSTFVGIFSALTSLLNNILEPEGYSADTSGIFGAIIIVGGLVGAAVFGVLIDRWPKHILVLRSATPLASASFIAFIFVVRPGTEIGIGVVSFILGFTTFSLLPVGLELGVECAFPAPEGTVSALLWMGGEALSAIYQLIMNALRWGDDSSHPGNMRDALIFCAVAISVAALLALFAFTGTLRRREAEKETIPSDSATVSSPPLP